MDDDLEPKAKLPKVAKVIVAEGFSISQYWQTDSARLV